MIEKTTCHHVDFTVPSDHRRKMKESENLIKYLDHTREIKKTVEHESSGDTNPGWYVVERSREIWKKKTRGKNRDHVDHSIVKICKNTQKSLET